MPAVLDLTDMDANLDGAAKYLESMSDDDLGVIARSTSLTGSLRMAAVYAGHVLRQRQKPATAPQTN
jgi:hypothetical protein